MPDHITHIEESAFYGCHSLIFIRLSRNLERIGEMAFYYCKSLQEVFLPPTATHIRDQAFKVCFSTSINPQTIQECIQEHGIKFTIKVDDQQMPALHILCANPHVTGDAIRAYLQVSPEAAEQEDSHGITPFQYLCRNDITFIDERTFLL